MATRAYRHVQLAQRKLFGADLETLRASRIETRAQFMMHADAASDDVPALVKDAHEAAAFLTENIAQTVQNSTGNYGVCRLLQQK